ncbi:MAG TPA: RQC domain-containing protein, partial [Nakamurella sp.]
TVPAQKVLSAVVRTGERFGAGHVIDVLAGRLTEKVASRGHDELPTFGAGADLDDLQWRSVIRQLVARGVLAPDPDRMGALTLTPAARPILAGTERVELRRFVKPEKVRKTRDRSEGRSGPATTASEPERELFEVLRAERRVIADAEGVPAYVVLPDRTLWELIATRPRTPADLLAVNGIGPVKAERYGAAFLALLAAQEPAGA